MVFITSFILYNAHCFNLEQEPQLTLLVIDIWYVEVYLTHFVSYTLYIMPTTDIAIFIEHATLCDILSTHYAFNLVDIV